MAEVMIGFLAACIARFQPFGRRGGTISASVSACAALGALGVSVSFAVAAGADGSFFGNPNVLGVGTSAMFLTALAKVNPESTAAGLSNAANGLDAADDGVAAAASGAADENGFENAAVAGLAGKRAALSCPVGDTAAAANGLLSALRGEVCAENGFAEAGVALGSAGFSANGFAFWKMSALVPADALAAANGLAEAGTSLDAAPNGLAVGSLVASELPKGLADPFGGTSFASSTVAANGLAGAAAAGALAKGLSANGLPNTASAFAPAAEPNGLSVAPANGSDAAGLSLARGTAGFDLRAAAPNGFAA
eukprot:Rhum_TRINITY_DN15079_c4_g1::Rhum_TRINITY_DN15079_c4_g1_i1::g.136899::m.136899